MTMTDEEVIPALQLWIDEDAEGIVEPMVPVRWCVTPQLTDILTENKVLNPHILLIVRAYRDDPYTRTEMIPGPEGTDDPPEYREVTVPRRIYTETRRYVAPLTAELQYVSFSRPGDNEITALVVYAKHGEGTRYLRTVYESRRRSFYRAAVFDHDGDQIDWRCNRIDAWGVAHRGYFVDGVRTSKDVVVPAELLPEEPQWVKDYLGKFSRTPSFDECQTRRRMLFGGAEFLPVYLVLAYILRIALVVLLLLLGMRQLRWRSFAHPFAYGIGDVANADEEFNSFWFQKKDGKARALPFLLLNPISNGILAAILFGIGSIRVHNNQHYLHVWWFTMSWWQAIAWSAMLHLGIGLVVFGIVSLVAFISGSSWNERREQRRQDREAAWLRELQAEMAQMYCNGAARTVALEALPKSKQTLRLKIQKTKHRVCRPYAH